MILTLLIFHDIMKFGFISSFFFLFFHFSMYLWNLGSHIPSHFLWRVGFLSFCDFSIFGKTSTFSWRCYITFNFCLSMFHVDCNEETSTKWFGLVYKHGVRLLWHCLDYSNSYCSGLDLSWQWTKSQLLQALMLDTLVRN